MNLQTILTFLALYERQGQKMRFHGKYDGRESGICIVAQWSGVSALFMPWSVFVDLAKTGAFKLERMSPAAGGGLHLRPNKKALKMALVQHQGEFTEVKLADCTSKDWKEEYEQWRAGRPKSVWNLGWYAEYRVHQYYGLPWEMVRNRRTKGMADMVLTDQNGKRHHWEIKDLVGAGFQLRPEQAVELGLDDLCTD